jgi:hypothetical protein
MLYGSQNTALFTYCYFYDKLFHIYHYFLQVTGIKHSLKPLYIHICPCKRKAKIYLFLRHNVPFRHLYYILSNLNRHNNSAPACHKMLFKSFIIMEKMCR